MGATSHRVRQRRLFRDALNRGSDDIISSGQTESKRLRLLSVCDPKSLGLVQAGLTGKPLPLLVAESLLLFIRGLLLCWRNA